MISMFCIRNNLKCLIKLTAITETVSGNEFER